MGGAKYLRPAELERNKAEVTKKWKKLNLIIRKKNWIQIITAVSKQI